MHTQNISVNPCPVIGKYDVVVCGGGPAGIAAALAARRAGLTVLLLESQGQLGGMGTAGLVSHWLGGRSIDCRWVVGGIFRTLSEEATAQGFALLPQPQAGASYQPHGWYLGLQNGIPFDPFAMAAYLDRKMVEAGGTILFGTQAVDAVVEEGRITHVLLANKNGLQAVMARAVIDATGDADITARAGCPTVVGREDDHLMTPTTLMFHVDNVDQATLSTYIHDEDQPRFRDLILQLRASGEWPFPYEIFISVQLQEPGVMMINTSRMVGVDGTDAASLSVGMRRGREETEQLLAIMRAHFPGFAHARLKAVAPLLGVRETRRIVGDFVLTVADLCAGNTFPDTIGYSSGGWDLPDPKRPSHQPMVVVQKPPNTPIPYRVLLPRGIANLICPGRAVSVERDVLGPLRLTAPVMAMGEAAGCAAAQVVTDNTSFARVDIPALLATLHAHGALLNQADLDG